MKKTAQYVYCTYIIFFLSFFLNLSIAGIYKNLPEKLLPISMSKVSIIITYGFHQNSPPPLPPFPPSLLTLPFPPSLLASFPPFSSKTNFYTFLFVGPNFPNFFTSSPPPPPPVPSPLTTLPLKSPRVASPYT